MEWEYLQAEILLGDPGVFNEYGARGWEAFAVDFDFRLATMLVLFKRPVKRPLQ